MHRIKKINKKQSSKPYPSVSMTKLNPRASLLILVFLKKCAIILEKFFQSGKTELWEFSVVEIPYFAKENLHHFASTKAELFVILGSGS